MLGRGGHKIQISNRSYLASGRLHLNEALIEGAYHSQRPSPRKLTDFGRNGHTAFGDFWPIKYGEPPIAQEPDGRPPAASPVTRPSSLSPRAAARVSRGGRARTRRQRWSRHRRRSTTTRPPPPDAANVATDTPSVPSERRSADAASRSLPRPP